MELFAYLVIYKEISVILGSFAMYLYLPRMLTLIVMKSRTPIRTIMKVYISLEWIYLYLSLFEEFIMLDNHVIFASCFFTFLVSYIFTTTRSNK